VAHSPFDKRSGEATRIWYAAIDCFAALALTISGSRDTRAHHREKRSPFDKRSGEAIQVRCAAMDCFACGSQ
jgi:hypothetical protein